jgi:hypothetical protein
VCCRLFCVPKFASDVKLCNDVDEHCNQGNSNQNLHVHVHHTRGKLYESLVMLRYHTHYWIRDRVWWHFARKFSLHRAKNFGKRGNIYLPPTLLQAKTHISPISSSLSKFKHSLLACSATSSPAPLLPAARPRRSSQVIHTCPHPPPPAPSHCWKYALEAINKMVIIIFPNSW